MVGGSIVNQEEILSAERIHKSLAWADPEAAAHEYVKTLIALDMAMSKIDNLEDKMWDMVERMEG
jgi:hypothetical protein